MTNLAFKLEERTSNEKAKATRRNGQTPCVIYGLDSPISAKISNSTLPKLLHAHLSTSILPLDINDSIKKCVIKDIQKDCYGKIIHLDFQYVQSNQIIKIKVPVTFEGQNLLVTKKLVLESFVSEIEVQGPAEKIPENIDIDVSNMQYEDKIIAKNIKLPDDIHLTTNGDTLLAHIAGSNPIEDEDEAAEATE